MRHEHCWINSLVCHLRRVIGGVKVELSGRTDNGVGVFLLCELHSVIQGWGCWWPVNSTGSRRDSSYCPKVGEPGRCGLVSLKRRP